MEVLIRVTDGKLTIGTKGVPDKFALLCLLLDAAKAAGQPAAAEAPAIRVPPPDVQRQLIGV